MLLTAWCLPWKKEGTLIGRSLGRLSICPGPMPSVHGPSMKPSRDFILWEEPDVVINVVDAQLSGTFSPFSSEMGAPWSWL